MIKFKRKKSSTVKLQVKGSKTVSVIKLCLWKSYSHMIW